MFGPDGGLVANAPHIPVHLGAMQEAVQYQVINIINSVTGVFLGRRFLTVERPSTWTTAARTELRLLQTVSEISSIW